MNLTHVVFTVLIVAYPSAISMMSVKRHYRRPVCEPSQSCSYSYQQFTFELCDCPNMRSCPTNNGVQLKGITYQFCTARQLPECQPGEIAAEVNILQTSLYCVCPRNEMYIKQKNNLETTAKYVCQEEKALCEMGQTCGVGNPIIGIKPICQCNTDQTCAIFSSDLFNPLLMQNATCRSRI